MTDVVWIGDEEEIAKHLERGYCSEPEWKQYWFIERCHAMEELGKLARRQEALKAYVNRCTDRLGDDHVRLVISH